MLGKNGPGDVGPDEPGLPRRWLLCWLLFAATALSFLDRQVLSVLAPTITREFALSNEAYGRVVFAFQASYTVMFSLGGWVVDVVGTRIGMAACLAVWSAASAAHSLVQNGMMLGAARFFLGVGEGGCLPAAAKGPAEWFAADRRALAMGIATGGSALGAVIAPPLVAWAATRMGWRTAFQMTGLLGFVWLAVWLAVFPRRSRSSAARARTSVGQWLTRSSVWWILGARFLFDPVFYFYMFWIPQYLSRERHMSVAQIGSSFWIPFLFSASARYSAAGFRTRW